MKKPSASAIRAAVPLTQRPERGADPILVCSVCGRDVDPKDLPSEVWREHDERDKPIAGTDALIFLGQEKAHEACKKLLGAHPRLYSHEMGAPGHFPLLCGPCVHRKGLECTHRDLKANGGAGLKVNTTTWPPFTIICIRGVGCTKPIATARECAGRELAGAAS